MMNPRGLLPFILILFFIMIPPFLIAGSQDLNVIDTPKTFTSYKGDLRFEFSMYDRGGILGSTVLSISDFAFLGVYFDVGQMIGSEKIQWNQPGVLARLIISDGSTVLPPIAIGYSYFMRGELNKVGGVTVNGIYVVSSQDYLLFGNEQSLFYGLRYPIIPLSYSRPENMSLFVSTDLELSPEFSIKGEIENIHLSSERWQENFYNFSFGLNIVDLITLAIEFRYSPSIERVIRILRVCYTTQF